MSMLDGFSIYNQLLVLEEDRPNIAFITPWERYVYAHIPFGLKKCLFLCIELMANVFKNLKYHWMYNNPEISRPNMGCINQERYYRLLVSRIVR